MVIKMQKITPKFYVYYKNKNKIIWLIIIIDNFKTQYLDCILKLKVFDLYHNKYNISLGRFEPCASLCIVFWLGLSCSWVCRATADTASDPSLFQYTISLETSISLNYLTITKTHDCPIFVSRFLYVWKHSIHIKNNQNITYILVL